MTLIYYIYPTIMTEVNVSVTMGMSARKVGALLGKCLMNL